MKKKKGFTLIELLVVISIIAMLLAILMPALGKVKKLAQQLVCGTNVKGLGTACFVYANDYDDDFPIQGGAGNNTWAASTPDWDEPGKQWNYDADGNPIDNEQTIASSLYLLIREADVGPKSFNCTAGDEKEFEAPGSGDLTELWDFGADPWKYQSYAYQFPYNNFPDRTSYPVSGTSNSANAVLADRNPWLDKLTSGGTPDAENYIDQVGLITPNGQSWQIDVGNAKSHSRNGQNVLFVDGHVSFENQPDCATRNDNIYTSFIGPNNWSENDRRIGEGKSDVSTLLSKTSTDSLLANEVPTEE